MNIHRALGLALLFAPGLLSGCGGSDDDGTTGAPATPTAAATTSTTATPSLQLTTEGPATKPGIDARVKAEVDKRSDGITGAAVSVGGSRATLQAPKEWTSAKGDVTVVTSADKKAQIGATAGSASTKLPAAIAALGLSACEWNQADSLAIGKDNLAGEGADGVCTRGSAKVKTAYVAAAAENLLVVGAWEEGGDSASVFGSMRSITKLAGGGGGDEIAACCRALQQNSNSAPPDQKPMYLQAAAICNGLRNSPQGKAALVQVRAMLRSANMPPACR